jgi:hypothetical protein
VREDRLDSRDDRAAIDGSEPLEPRRPGPPFDTRCAIALSYYTPVNGRPPTAEPVRRARLRLGARIAAPVLVFGYLTFVRTRGISQTFWLLGDQILYWRIALSSWHDIPIGGGFSSVGGTTLGPVFFWTLWAIRHLVGPWTENLPHAGGIGLGIIQSAADACLFAALWKRFSSPLLALAVILVVATAPYDMALTATIWNPPLSVAFVKLSLAIVLFDTAGSLGAQAAATAAAMLAVQAHSSAIFLAAPLIAAFTAREAFARRWERAVHSAVVSAAVIALLELPFLINLVIHRGSGVAPIVVVDNLSYAVAHPRVIRPIASFRALASACAFILLRPWTFAWTGAVLVVGALVTAWRLRRDLVLVCATVVPLICTVVGFSFWQRTYDHYWYLVIAPSGALTVALALTAWRPAASVVAAVLALVAVAAQPARVADAMTIHRLPQYEPLSRGSRAIRRYTADVRSIRTEFALPDSTDRTFLFRVLGGRVTPEAKYHATIGPTGAITFTPVSGRAAMPADLPAVGRAP